MVRHVSGKPFYLVTKCVVLNIIVHYSNPSVIGNFCLKCTKNIHAMHEKPLGRGSRLWPWRWRSRSLIMNRVLAHTIMHSWYEYGKCSLNRSGVITLTRWWRRQTQMTIPLRPESRGLMKQKIRISYTMWWHHHRPPQPVLYRKWLAWISQMSLFPMKKIVLHHTFLPR